MGAMRDGLSGVLNLGRNIVSGGYGAEVGGGARGVCGAQLANVPASSSSSSSSILPICAAPLWNFFWGMGAQEQGSWMPNNLGIRAAFGGVTTLTPTLVSSCSSCYTSLI